jgi:hypothetical protein
MALLSVSAVSVMVVAMTAGGQHDIARTTNWSHLLPAAPHTSYNRPPQTPRVVVDRLVSTVDALPSAGSFCGLACTTMPMGRGLAVVVASRLSSDSDAHATVAGCQQQLIQIPA